MSQPAAVTFREVEQLLAHGFTGQIILHCAQGSIVRYEKRETVIPGKLNGTSAKPGPNS